MSQRPRKPPKRQPIEEWLDHFVPALKAEMVKRGDDPVDGFASLFWQLSEHFEKAAVEEGRLELERRAQAARDAGA